MLLRRMLWKVRREEKQTRCHRIVYCTYNMLNMIRALLCPSSGARDYMCVITSYGVQCLGCWLSEVRKRDIARLQSTYIPHSGRIACFPAPDIRQPATKALHTVGGNNTHLVSSS